MKRKLTVLLLALLVSFAVFPAIAYAADGDGDGYDDNDFVKMQAFLELNSAVAGQKNGQLLSDSYDPANPATWTGILWNSGTPKRITEISAVGLGLAGSLDVSGFTALTLLNCDENHLTGVNLAGCTALEAIEISKNPELTALDVSNLTALADVFCPECAIATLDLSGCTALETLLCDTNQLTALDLSGLTSLMSLSCSDNRLTALDVSMLPQLFALSCDGNQLAALDVSACTDMMGLACGNNELTSLTLGENDTMFSLACEDNHLTALDVSGLPSLFLFSCAENELTSIDLSGNDGLLLILCNDNQLTGLDVSNAESLIALDCSNNRLASLDLSANKYMMSLLCSGNPLTSVKAYFSATPPTISANKKIPKKFGRLVPTPPTGNSAVTLTAKGNGYVELYCNMGDFYANAVPKTGETFLNWSQAGAVVTANLKYNLTMGKNYTLAAGFTPVTLQPSKAGGQIYSGGRITISPSIPGGTWSYPHDKLSAKITGSVAEFKGLKEGTARATYTVGGFSSYIDIVILKSELPATGQDFTPALWLLAAAACAGAAALAVSVLIRRRMRAK